MQLHCQAQWFADHAVSWSNMASPHLSSALATFAIHTLAYNVYSCISLSCILLPCYPCHAIPKSISKVEMVEMVGNCHCILPGHTSAMPLRSGEKVGPQLSSRLYILLAEGPARWSSGQRTAASLGRQHRTRKTNDLSLRQCLKR